MEQIKDYVERRGEGYYVAGRFTGVPGFHRHGFLARAGSGKHSSLVSFANPCTSVWGNCVLSVQPNGIDAYLKEWEMRTEEQRLAARRAHPDLHERLTTARQETSVPRS
jgi:hypothetical protein